MRLGFNPRRIFNVIDLPAAACSGRLTENGRESNNLPDCRHTSLEKACVEIQIGPFGSLLHRHDYVEGCIPLINPMHIKEGEIFPTQEYAVSAAKARQLAQYRLSADSPKRSGDE
jgi:hypothetical protein